MLKGIDGAGVLEVVQDDAGGTYRAVYAMKFAQAVFVLHCFQKKSKRGIATAGPKWLKRLQRSCEMEKRLIHGPATQNS